MQESWGHNSSRKAWEARQYVAVLESLVEAADRVIHENVSMKPKLQWRCQEIRDANSMECLPRNTAGREQSQH
jgi:hypothetical protein